MLAGIQTTFKIQPFLGRMGLDNSGGSKTKRVQYLDGQLCLVLNIIFPIEI